MRYSLPGRARRAGVAAVAAGSARGLALAGAVALAASGCDAMKAKPSAGADATSPRETAAPVASTVSAKLGCVPIALGGQAVAREIGATSAAAAGGRILVVTWRQGAGASRVVLASDARVASPQSPVLEGAGAGADGGGDGDAGATRTWAAAGTFRGQLATVAYGVGYADGARCADAKVTIAPREGTPSVFSVEACKAPSAFAAASRGELAIVALDGDRATLGLPGKGIGLDAIIIGDGGARRAVRLDELDARSTHGRPAGGRPAADAGSAARAGGASAPADGGGAAAGDGAPGDAGVTSGLAAATGATWAAVAWVVDAGGARELRIAGLDGAGGRTSAKPLTLDRGVVGSPSLAFEGDVVHVVWAAREADRAVSRLRWAKWDGRDAPAAAQVLATGSAPTAAPAIAIGPSGRFVVAWEEGPEGTTVVKAGASRVNILKAVLGAAAVSSRGARASAPAVALEGDSATAVWSEIGPEGSLLRATQLRCIE